MHTIAYIYGSFQTLHHSRYRFANTTRNDEVGEGWAKIKIYDICNASKLKNLGVWNNEKSGNTSVKLYSMERILRYHKFCG